MLSLRNDLVQKKRLRLLVLDVDGTLLTSRHQMSAATRTAVHRLVADGVQIVLASGRSPLSLQPLLKELSISGYVIAFSGGVLYQQTGAAPEMVTIIKEQCLALSSAQFIARQGLLHEVSLGWFVGRQWYIQAWDDTLRYEASVIGMPEITAVPLPARTDPPHKIQCMVADPRQAFKLKQIRDVLPDDCVGHFTHQTYLEIMPRGVDKAASLQILSQQLGIQLDEMAAIGDGENDLAMLQSVGIGVAMGQAPTAVKAVANWHTGTNDEDGVARAVERLRSEGYL